MNKNILFIYNSLSLSGRQLLKSSRLKFIFGLIIVTAGILGWLIYRQRTLFLTFHWEFHPIPILLSFVLYSLTLFEVAVAWSSMMNALGGKVNFQKHFRFFSISLIAKRLPGTIWYIPWRAKMYESTGFSLRMISLASGIEIAVTIISGVISATFFAMPVLNKYPAGICVGLLLFLISLLMLHPLVIRKIAQFLKVEMGQIKYIRILRWIAIYIIFWLTSGIMLFFIVNIFYPVPFVYINEIIGAWILTGTLSFTLLFLPSNFGFTEISLSLLLSGIVPSPIAVVIAVGTRILLFSYDLIWALPMVLLEYLDRRKLTP